VGQFIKPLLVINGKVGGVGGRRIFAESGVHGMEGDRWTEGEEEGCGG